MPFKFIFEQGKKVKRRVPVAPDVLCIGKKREKDEEAMPAIRRKRKKGQVFPSPFNQGKRKREP